MPEIKKETKAKSKTEFNLDEEEMLKAGLHFGHRSSRLHPKMEPYIFGVRKTVHIIDLEKTRQKFEEALKFIKELASQGKIILFVGTKIPHKELLKKITQECSMPYVSERWLGGSLTNFKVMKQRIKTLKGLEEKKQSEGFEKYTKKERAQIEEEIQRLENKFGGIKNLEDLPNAVFICDMRKDGLAAKEARMKEIPVIGIVDTNIDPTQADYPIPANDDAISSVRYILEKVKEVILKSKSVSKSVEK